MHEAQTLNLKTGSSTGLTTAQKVELVVLMVTDGMKLYRACQKIGISKETYHAYRRGTRGKGKQKENPPSPDTAEGGSDNADDLSPCPHSLAHAGPDHVTQEVA